MRFLGLPRERLRAARAMMRPVLPSSMTPWNSVPVNFLAMMEFLLS